MPPSLPYISVIVPVRNGGETVERTLKSLEEVHYPKDRIEVLVVDNLSDDNTLSLLQGHSVRILHERGKRGSYAARNLGIRQARGELLAFTDADCVVSPDWLLHHTATLDAHDVDISAGSVQLLMNPRPNIFETYDRCKSLNQEFYVNEFHFGATANLVVRRTVFDKIGLFDGELQSSGDLEFGQRAYKTGFRIGYSDQAVVHHHSRSTLKELMKKQRRIGYGYAQIYFRYGIGHLAIHRRKMFLPNRDLLRFTDCGKNLNKGGKLQFVLVDWLCNCSWIYGNLLGVLRSRTMGT